MNNSSQKSDSGHDKPRKNPLEWVVFAFSLVLVLGTLGFLGYETLVVPMTPPRLEAHLGKLEIRGSLMFVAVTVENDGATTATNVEVEVKSRDGQSAGFTLQHVPRNGKREGWVSFEAPLDKSQLQARVAGYQIP